MTSINSDNESEAPMEKEYIEIVIKVAACVCGKDGVISEAEENKIYELIQIKDSSVSKEKFNKVLDDFFESTEQIEDYLLDVNTDDDRKFIIELCELSASADGLDIKENIALHKVKLILGDEL